MNGDRELRELVERLQAENAALRGANEALTATRTELEQVRAQNEALRRQLDLADENRDRAAETHRLLEESIAEVEGQLRRELEIAQAEQSRLRNLLDTARLELELARRK